MDFQGVTLSGGAALFTPTYPSYRVGPHVAHPQLEIDPCESSDGRVKRNK